MPDILSLNPASVSFYGVWFFESLHFEIPSLQFLVWSPFYFYFFFSSIFKFSVDLIFPVNGCFKSPSGSLAGIPPLYFLQFFFLLLLATELWHAWGWAGTCGTAAPIFLVFYLFFPVIFILLSLVNIEGVDLHRRFINVQHS